MLAEWMSLNGSENPLYEHYDEILDILYEYNVVISLGDSLRPGAIKDANDRGQVHEMIILGELAQRARERGVQAIIEGPGHVQLDMIEENIRLQKTVCQGCCWGADSGWLRMKWCMTCSRVWTSSRSFFCCAARMSSTIMRQITSLPCSFFSRYCP